MVERDYMMRQIEQLSMALRRLLSKLLNLNDTGSDSVSVVNQHFSEELGIDLTRLSEIPDAQWIDTLQNTMHFDPVNLEKVADLLMYVGENELFPDRLSLYRKSMLIYRHLETVEKTYSLERNFNIQKLESLIDSESRE